MRNEEIALLDFSGWPIPDQFLREIGRVAVLWGLLESFLNVCLGKLAGFNDLLNDPKPFILITHSSFPQRLDILGALCERLLEKFPHLTNYKNVVSQLKTAQATRNRFTHHAITYNVQSDRIEMPMGSARGKLKATVEIFSMEDIKKASIEIDEAQRTLYKLVLQRDLPPAWQRRSPRIT